jgi:DNA polymerase III subunit epsilon
MIVIDCETGGLDPAADALVSVAIYHTGTRDMLTMLCRPAEGLGWHPAAEKVHGVSRAFAEAKGISETDVMVRVGQVLAKWPDDDIVGANPRFDIAFLEAAAKRTGVPVRFRRPIDVQSVAWVADKIGVIELPRKKGGGPASISLDSILKALGNQRAEKCHDAAEDAALTAWAMQRLLTLLRTSREVLS